MQRSLRAAFEEVEHAEKSTSATLTETPAVYRKANSARRQWIEILAAPDRAPSVPLLGIQTSCGEFPDPKTDCSSRARWHSTMRLGNRYVRERGFSQTAPAYRMQDGAPRHRGRCKQQRSTPPTSVNASARTVLQSSLGGHTLHQLPRPITSLHECGRHSV